MRRLSSSLLYALMITTLILAGCTSNKKTEEPKPTTEQTIVNNPSSDKAANPMPISKDGTATLTVAIPDNIYAPASFANNLPVYQEIEKITGVKIKWDVVAYSQYNTSMQTRLAAATNLPDVLSVPGSDPFQYGKGGIIIPLDDMLNKFGENAAKAYAEKTLLLPVQTAPDGHVYHLSGARDEEMAASPRGWLVRKDWLDKLGLQEPKSPDDWYNMLKAFKTQDPNGNGKVDEIPLLLDNNLQSVYIWGGVWGLHTGSSDGFYADKNGKITYAWLDPKAKDMITFLNKLYKEGLIDPEYTANTSDQVTSKIIRNITGATVSFQESGPAWNNRLKDAGVSNPNWVLTNIPTAKGATDNGFIETIALPAGALAISKDCKNPELAFKWLDYVVYNDKANVLQTIGIEGTTYTVENGKYKMTDFVLKNPKGLGPVETVRSIGGWGTIPHINKRDLVQALKLSDADLVKRAQTYEPYIMPRIEFAAATQEEYQTITRIYTDLKTYRDEMITKFIIGQERLDNWDKFINTLKDMEIEQVVKIKQAQYDRLMKLKK